MKVKKFLTVVLSALLCCTALTGCVGGSGGGSKVDASKTTVITIGVPNKGFGTQWVSNAAKRFEEANAETVFAEGKKGVHVEVVPETDSSYVQTLSTSGDNIAILEQITEVREFAQNGTVLAIDDVLTEKSDVRNGAEMSIEDKINEENRLSLKGRDGHYYGLPLYENTPGLSYDVDLFVNNNLYFADDGESAVTPFSSSYGNVNFVANANAKKNCGSDGVYGTEDDGLPTSLQDMLILFARMKQLGISPVTLPGMYLNYANYLYLGLWASLAGYDEMRTNYTFKGDIEVVTGFTNEPLFQGAGLSGIKKPTTETVHIDGTDGYKIYDSAARYYALAFVQALQTLGWFTKDAETSTVSHTDAQGKFIYGGVGTNPKIGTICEGSYWWQETEEKAANISSYLADTRKTERNIAFMSPPTSVNGPRPTEGQAEEVTYLDISSAYCILNANIASNEEVVKACKAFLKFFYSDAELEAYTEFSGINIAKVNYPISDASYGRMDTFKKSVQNLTRRSSNSKVVYAVADNPTFLASPGTFKLYQWNSMVKPVINNVTYDSPLAAMRRSISLTDIFNANRISQSTWAGLYKTE